MIPKPNPEISLKDFSKLIVPKNRPATAQIEVTYLCNLRCQFCYNPTHESVGEMTTAQMIYCLDELKRLGCFELTLTGGECLARPDIFTLLEEAHKRQFLVGIFTNATLIDEATAEKLFASPVAFFQTSIHGVDDSTFERESCVPGSFQRFLKAAELLKNAPFGVEWSTVVTSHNWHQLHEIKALSKKYNVRRVKFSLDISPRDNGDLSPLDLMVDDDVRRRFYSEEYDALLRDGQPPVLAERQFAEQEAVCGTGTNAVAIDPYGNIYPCLKFRRRIGNILKDDVVALWEKSQTLEEVRDIVRRVPVETFKEDERGFAHFCAGIAEMKTGSPMEVFEDEWKELQVRRERFRRDQQRKSAASGS
jgi:MoaA/NifB/PqqE/SkfB family radical SAM enzyme